MTLDEAKTRIMAEWRSWNGHGHEGLPAGFNDALAFFEHLQKGRLKLLAFEYHGDKWELVKGWLLPLREATD